MAGTMKKVFDPRQLPLDFRVQVEPALRGAAVGKTPDELAALARVYYRWAKQLWVLETALRQDCDLPPPPPAERPPPCLRSKPMVWRN